MEKPELNEEDKILIKTLESSNEKLERPIYALELFQQLLQTNPEMIGKECLSNAFRYI